MKGMTFTQSSSLPSVCSAYSYDSLLYLSLAGEIDQRRFCWKILAYRLQKKVSVAFGLHPLESWASLFGHNISSCPIDDDNENAMRVRDSGSEKLLLLSINMPFLLPARDR